MTTENTLTSLQYKFEIDRLPGVIYHSQTCVLPSIQIDQPQFNTPHIDTVLPGTKLTFDPLIIEFIVDENLENYIEIVRWLFEMITVAPENYTKMKTDATLHILKPNGVPQSKIKFFNCIPSMVSEMSFDSKAPSADPIVCSLTLNYSHFLPEAIAEDFKL